MKAYIAFSIIALWPWQTLAQEVMKLPTLPKASAITGIENSPGSLFTPYMTDNLYFEMPLSELIDFVKRGKATEITGDSWKLIELAPFTPNRVLNDREKEVLKTWKAFKTNYGVCVGAFTTKDGQIFLWKKLNDRVLLICQHDRACFLVLPKEKG